MSKSITELMGWLKEWNQVGLPTQFHNPLFDQMTVLQNSLPVLPAALWLKDMQHLGISEQLSHQLIQRPTLLEGLAKQLTPFTVLATPMDAISGSIVKHSLGLTAGLATWAQHPSTWGGNAALQFQEPILAAIGSLSDVKGAVNEVEVLQECADTLRDLDALVAEHTNTEEVISAADQLALTKEIGELVEQRREATTNEHTLVFLACLDGIFELEVSAHLAYVSLRHPVGSAVQADLDQYRNR